MSQKYSRFILDEFNYIVNNSLLCLKSLYPLYKVEQMLRYLNAVTFKLHKIRYGLWYCFSLKRRDIKISIRRNKDMVT